MSWKQKLTVWIWTALLYLPFDNPATLAMSSFSQPCSRCGVVVFGEASSESERGDPDRHVEILPRRCQLCFLLAKAVSRSHVTVPTCAGIWHFMRGTVHSRCSHHPTSH